MKVDMIIPTYKPDDTFCLLLQKLREQTFVVHRLILINTEESLWRAAGEKYPIEEALAALPCEYEVIHVRKEEFDHGGTRNLGASRSDADVILFMTQDAVPADSYLVEKLVNTFVEQMQSGDGAQQQNSDVSIQKSTGGIRESCKEAERGRERDVPENGVTAVAYARQLPNADCGTVERYTRQFNYPGESRKKSREDLPELGIKTFFCSDVCAAYRRDIFVKQRCFETPAIFNEDMFFAAKAIMAGCTVEYAADAKVIHSHNYSVRQQFQRNFDLAVSQADHPEIFSQVSSESEGMRLVKSTMAHLCRIGKPWLIWNLVWQCAAKYAGYFLGKRYKKLSRKFILKCTMSPDYWKKIWGEP